MCSLSRPSENSQKINVIHYRGPQLHSVILRCSSIGSVHLNAWIHHSVTSLFPASCERMLIWAWLIADKIGRRVILLKVFSCFPEGWPCHLTIQGKHSIPNASYQTENPSAIQSKATMALIIVSFLFRHGWVHSSSQAHLAALFHLGGRKFYGHRKKFHRAKVILPTVTNASHKEVHDPQGTDKRMTVP